MDSPHDTPPPELAELDDAIAEMGGAAILGPFRQLISALLLSTGPEFTAYIVRGTHAEVMPLHARWKAAHAVGDRGSALRARAEFRRYMADVKPLPAGLTIVQIEHDDGCPALRTGRASDCRCRPNVRLAPFSAAHGRPEQGHGGARW